MAEFDDETSSQRNQRIADQYREKALQSNNSQEAEYYQAKADQYEEKAKNYRRQGD